MKLKLISVWNWLEVFVIVGVWTVLVTVVFVFTFPFDRNRRFVGRLFRDGGLAMIHLNPLWRVQVTGYRPQRADGPYVVVSNHQSLADIPVLSVLPGEMKWLSKASIFALPFFGWMMRMVGDIPLHRGDRDSTSGAMTRARAYLDSGMSVMIFPEGTRSPEGEVGVFKTGAFRLAIESGRPILPVVIAGSRACIPKKSWVFGGRCDVRVHVFSPVFVADLTVDAAEAFAKRVRDEIARGFECLGKSAPFYGSAVGIHWK